MSAPPVDTTHTASAPEHEATSRSPRRGHRIDPLAKIVVILPPMVLVLFTRDVFTPLVFTLAGGVLVLAATRPRPLRLALAAVPVLLAGAWAVVVFALSAAPEVSAGTPVVVQWGPLTLHAGALELGAATVLRIAALVVLACLGGVGTAAAHLVSALVVHLKVPYRIAFVALAGLRLIPRLRHDAAVINAAHRIRGVQERRGPVGVLVRGRRMLLPLMASGIRHAERVSLAMDARGFGAHATRRDRDPARFTRKDTLVVAVGLAASLALVWLSATLGHLELVSSVY